MGSNPARSSEVRSKGHGLSTAITSNVLRDISHPAPYLILTCTGRSDTVIWLYINPYRTYLPVYLLTGGLPRKGTEDG